MKLSKQEKAKLPDRFYTPTYSSQQMGMYKLLIKKRGISPEIICECLDEYRDKYLQWLYPKETDSNSSKKYWTDKRIKHATIEYANDNFGKFLKIVSAKTGQSFKQNKNNVSRDYNDWWQERNLDGTFAYSGVTDDF